MAMAIGNAIIYLFACWGALSLIHDLDRWTTARKIKHDPTVTDLPSYNAGYEKANEVWRKTLEEAMPFEVDSNPDQFVEDLKESLQEHMENYFE